MIRFFTENRGFAALLLPLFIVAYFVLNAANSAPFEHLYFGFFGDYATQNSTMLQVIAASMLLVNASLLNYVFNIHNFYTKTTYLPAFIYIVWMSFYKEMYEPSGVLFSHTFFVLAINQLFYLNQNEDGRRNVFNASLFFGVGACLQPAILVIFPFIFISVWILRPFVFRETLLVMAGFLTPFLYAWVASTFQDKSFFEGWEFKIINFQDFNVFAIVFASFTLLFSLLSFWGMNVQMNKSSIRFRKQIRVLSWLFFASLIMGTINFITQKTTPFSYSFIILPIYALFAFLVKPISLFMNSLITLLVLLSFIRFFISI